MAKEDFLVVAAFYKFVNLPDFEEMQTPLLSCCQTHQIKGTILLAPEGINGTISGSRPGIDAILAFLGRDSRLTNLEYKESYTDNSPFDRMKVRLKSEIVTLGIPEVDPNMQVGTYISPQAWNNLILDPEVTVIDTRNDYEVMIGTFKRAANPQTESFRDFPAYVHHNLHPAKHKKIALFCTGGIRCEKASSYMLAQGFAEVYHLKGGILKYLEEIPPDESLWEGECFVFDQRVAVGPGLAPGSYELCFCCGHPINDADKTSPKYQEGISCIHCFDSLTEDKIVRQQEKWRQYQLINRE